MTWEKYQKCRVRILGKSNLGNTLYKIVVSRNFKLAVRGLNDKVMQKLESEKQHALTQMKMLPHLVVSSLNDMRDVLKVKKVNEWEGNKISVNYDPNSDEYAQISKIAVDNELEVVPFDHEVEMDRNRNVGNGYGHPEWKR
ncbi:hypothetical protein PRUPE_2G155400 [Prunus persica]|uniref:Uncharacterized protein n=1 Tax=Prunus persica TaxID=3760 RepID=A0A251QGA0_PRUPE|nr:uncharacterized protein LOC109946993 isoform X2 [Prunus persica]ONI22864.1 hypothetical protein PRUPE_2G155400 [Prunus persica]